MSLIIPSTSRTVMRVTTPPVGWTKDTSFNEFTLRVTTGSVTSAGAINFTTVFNDYTVQPATVTISPTVGSVTLTTSQLPTHRHDRLWVGPTRTSSPGRGQPTAYQSTLRATYSSTLTHNDNTPAPTGTSHTHPIGTVSSSSISGGLDFRLLYVDIILVTRN